LDYTQMPASVKSATNSVIAERLDRLRLQAMAAKKAKLAARIGTNIRRRRKELGLETQRDLLERMGDHGPPDAQAISDWERGVRKPSERYMPLLVKALELDDAGWLYQDHDSDPIEASEAPLAIDRIERVERKLDQVIRLLTPLELTGVQLAAPPSEPEEPKAPPATRRQRHGPEAG